MKDFFDRHERVGLLFSGGKDSLTCLYKCKPYWDKLYVLWANTGKNFPEIEEFMEEVKAMVPHFIECRSNQDAFIKANGYPTEVAVTRILPEHRQFDTQGCNQRVVTKHQCCKNNLWRPVQGMLEAVDCTAFVKGQRGDDPYNDTWPTHIQVGERVCEMLYPCRYLKEEDCLAFLKAEGVNLTERFFIGRTSLDCWDCTGYWEYVPERLKYMAKHHPDKHAHVVQIFKNIKADVNKSIALLP